MDHLPLVHNVRLKNSLWTKAITYTVSGHGGGRVGGKGPTYGYFCRVVNVVEHVWLGGTRKRPSDASTTPSTTPTKKKQATRSTNACKPPSTASAKKKQATSVGYARCIVTTLN
ncbi:hypothetical protein Tco_0368001 [Tanacetum coccineum]